MQAFATSAGVDGVFQPAPKPCNSKCNSDAAYMAMCASCAEMSWVFARAGYTFWLAATKEGWLFSCDTQDDGYAGAGGFEVKREGLLACASLFGTTRTSHWHQHVAPQACKEMGDRFPTCLATTV